MEYILQILIIFILIGCLLKISFWKLWQSALFALGCAWFIIGTRQWAILQSKTQLSDFFNNANVMQNAAVLITIELTLCFVFCFTELNALFDIPQKKWWKPLIRWYPGLMVFPVLFYLQTQFIFAMTGSNFTLLSWVFATAVFAALPLFSRLLKWLCTEKELRLEVYFLVNLFICLIGLITTVNGKITCSAAKNSVDIKTLLLSSGMLIIFFALGIIADKGKWKRSII